MTVPLARPARMTTDEFIAWAMEQPEGNRYELVAGEVFAMAPERLAHVQAKFAITLALQQAIAAVGLPCRAFVDGLAVRVDDATVYQPDALVRCGEALPGDTLEIGDPVIVAEVLSPSTSGRDMGAKLEDYLRLPSVRHYLIVRTETRSVIHHRKDEAGRISTAILRGPGTLELDPPGLSVDVEAFFL